jgi:hypothetical protein
MSGHLRKRIFKMSGQQRTRTPNRTIANTAITMPWEANCTRPVRRSTEPKRWRGQFRYTKCRALSRWTNLFRRKRVAFLIRRNCNHSRQRELPRPGKEDRHRQLRRGSFPGAHVPQLPPGESADPLHATLLRVHCDCRIPDGPIPCACTQLCGHSENPFSQVAAHMAAGRARWSRRR